ncbi:SIR2 family protein [Burkholderia anthina]|uniref:SIR2 family protein n=1 Tax=Burkholderia anthina TaxID=179879 RepID=UPI001588DB39|nr:SIR2 family protein [Burkholderia anthina]
MLLPSALRVAVGYGIRYQALFDVVFDQTETKLRFLPDGPSIPNELLSLRDKGEVVFFCGAGVSMPVGLPSFFKLTKCVMTRLGVSPASKIGKLMAPAMEKNDPDLAPPLDQVFGLLHREYSRPRVEREVNWLLKIPKAANPTKHEAILRLSADASGTPLVVTTNFDLMFERANRQLRRWTPPLLPPMTAMEVPTGIVYLHGRLRQQSDDGQNLVLSSADFGRAYLADGWATTFMRQLLEQRVVVLLGYSASDPPVRYLLEGLSASNSAKLRTIYAFDRGEPETVRAKWHELGVTGIAFRQFDDLWTTLEAWSVRAINKDSWTASVLAHAHTSPRSLLPHQRGQVVALVETREGAKAFADAEPPPPAEWLCVFDKFSRYGRPEKNGWSNDAAEINPHVEFGLDDDPPRPPANSRSTDVGGVDLIGTLATDDDGQNYMRLAGMRSSPGTVDSKRLWWLVRWFERVAEQPAAIWWAARQRSLHSSLLEAVDRRLNGRNGAVSAFEGESRHIWALMSESFAELPEDVREFSWYRLADRIRTEGWSTSVLRKLEKIAQPRLSVKAMSATRPPVPPPIDESVDMERLVRFEVVTAQRHGADINVPDHLVLAVFQIVRRILLRSIDLLNEIIGSLSYFRLPAIEPDARPGGHIRHREGVEADFFWAVELFQRLCDLYPEGARDEMVTWPKSDRYFFDKLKLHFWRNRIVFDGECVEQGLNGLSDEVFWNAYMRREVLLLLKDRWCDVRPEIRRRIEQRFIDGRQPYEGEAPEDYEQRVIFDAGTSLGWLERNGCELSRSAVNILSAIRRRPDWSEDAEKAADHDWDGRSGWVQRKTDPENLLHLPLAEIIPQALKLSRHDNSDFVEHAPFAGLASARPVRALRALSLYEPGGDHSVFLWKQLLSNWPDAAPRKALLICAYKLAGAQEDLFFRIRFEATSWIEKYLPRLFSYRKNVFWSLWDRVFDKIIAMGGRATESAIHEIRQGGEVKSFSRSMDFAINAPVGRMVETLFSTFGGKCYQLNEGLDVELLERICRALTSPGDGAHHAATLVGRRLNFLFYVDSRWVKRRILQLFSRKNTLSNAVWAGLIWEANVPSAALFHLLKSDFIALFSESKSLLSDEELERNAVHMLIVARYWWANDRRYINAVECRRILQEISDLGRQSALWMVGRIVVDQSAWETFGKSFFVSTWPQEVVLQSSAITESMIRMAQDLPNLFNKVVETVRDYLTPIEHPDVVLYGLREKMTENLSLSRRWPKQVLFLIDRIIEQAPSYPPMGLRELLDEIVEAAPTLRTAKSWRRLHNLLSE